MDKHTTLVIGASENTDRYANMAVRSLVSHGKSVAALGLKPGEILGIPIQTEMSADSYTDIDTVTLYLNPKRQEAYYDFILALKPRRVIFNPGTENSLFQQMLAANQIEPIEACTLVMLSTGQY